MRAIEALANHRASLGLLYRLPTREEQTAVRRALGDSVLSYPFAQGGIAVLRNASSAAKSVSMSELRGMFRGKAVPAQAHAYLSDPNDGLWDALRVSLGVPVDAEKPEGVVFLRDPGEVLTAVARDPRAVGFASTLCLPDSVDADSVRIVPVVPDTTSTPVAPGFEEIARSHYPLRHPVYMACLANGGLRASMFITYLTSDPGQRDVARAGGVPARWPMRPIYLTRKPIGSTH